ncbi:hypothetical protein SSX86_018104 [Deinandra increscens subsp. villosa]|uniref:Iron-binding zinc finger CDGSH type domain-containing protein n=1 Tax=Deinandra increscens subsp. villosa TaxID=3103831 RepID=A0AAP0CX83_9ASTR
MATMVVGIGLPFGLSSSPPQKKKALKNYTLGGHSTRRLVAVRAEGGGAINPEIRKTEEKVVDAVVVTELTKPVTAYCRCWRSGTFPLCDGGHVKHNKATGDNVGPLSHYHHHPILEIDVLKHQVQASSVPAMSLLVNSCKAVSAALIS